MRRRQFVKHTGLIASVVMLPSCIATTSSAKYRMGLQLFTIRDAMDVDPIGTLHKVAAIGYQDLETYGYDHEQDMYYGFKSAELLKRLTDIGLTTSSGHYGLADYLDRPKGEMERYVDQCIVGAKALGQSYITWPWLPPEKRNLESFKALPDVLNAIGEQVNNAGLRFAYHNHDFEFMEFDGETGYDIITRGTDHALVKLQLDMYWAAHSSSLSSAELIARDPKRFVMWHIKDMDRVTRDYTELGNGSIDYHEVLSEASQEGLEYYFIEQGGNFAVNSVQSIADSAAYFKAELKQYL